MAEKARRNLMVHDAALAQEIVHHAKAIVLVGDVFRRPDIDDKIERAAQVGRRFADIEVERDAVAMAVIVNGRELESERGPKRTRWRRLAGEVCLTAWAAEVDATCAK